MGGEERRDQHEALEGIFEVPEGRVKVVFEQSPPRHRGRANAAHQRGRVLNWLTMQTVVRDLRCMRLD